MELIEVTPDFAVAVKPVGVDSEKEFPAALQAHLGGTLFPVHRLDKNVAGLMVYARTKAAAAALSQAIQEGSMIKEYRAMVHGTPDEQGSWEDLLWKDNTKNKVFVVKRMRKGVKPARLEFRRISDGPDSLVHIRLHTGRSHQIRVQFACRGYPLVGDHKYGAKDSAIAPMLFSCGLTFPFRGKTYHYESFPQWG